MIVRFERLLAEISRKLGRLHVVNIGAIKFVRKAARRDGGRRNSHESTISANSARGQEQAMTLFADLYTVRLSVTNFLSISLTSTSRVDNNMRPELPLLRVWSQQLPEILRMCWERTLRMRPTFAEADR